MFLRTPPELNVTELRDLMVPMNGTVMVVEPSQVEVDLIESRAIRVGSEEVPVTDDSYQSLGKWLEVPYKFLQRQERDFQQLIVENLLRRARGEVAMEFDTERGLLDVRSPDVHVIDPRRFVDIATRVIDPEAQVINYHLSPESLMFEVVVPEGFEQGWGGDPQVGDITAGGLRFGQNRKRNLAPWVQRYFYRLACTNGYETLDEGLKVDARVATVDEILADLEMKARVAFGNVEAEIAALYNLRNEKVNDASQAVLRLAGEGDVPDRTTMAIIERVPEVIEDTSDASLFDVVNLITNQANEPGISNRVKVRRTLEQAGGLQVSEHISRCHACASRLN